MYNFIPPETTIKSTPSIPTSETAIKEGQDKLEKSYSEANKAASYIEGGIHQLNNAQTANMQNFISDTAKSTQHELSERSFEQNFPQYIAIKAAIAHYDLYKKGIPLNEKAQVAISIIEKGKASVPTFELEDILLPYLIEKREMNILSPNEKEVLDRRFSKDSNTFERLKQSFTLNYIHFNQDGLSLEQYFEKFPNTREVFENFLVLYGSHDSKSSNSETTKHNK